MITNKKTVKPWKGCRFNDRMCNIYDRKNKSGDTKKIYSDHNVIILKVDFNDRDAKRKTDMKL